MDLVALETVTGVEANDLVDRQDSGVTLPGTTGPNVRAQRSGDDLHLRKERGSRGDGLLRAAVPCGLG
jgi:hypothetical protein